jgi:hypothetical protein
MAAIGVVPPLMLVPVSMKRLVKSSRCRQLPGRVRAQGRDELRLVPAPRLAPLGEDAQG